MPGVGFAADNTVVVASSRVAVAADSSGAVVGVGGEHAISPDINTIRAKLMMDDGHMP